MSVFTDPQSNQTTTEQPNTETPTTESFVNQLVTSKGENFRDPEVLAKSKLEADAFIESLERQNKELREDLSKQDYSKDLLAQLQEKATSPTNVNPVVEDTNSGTESPSNTTPGVSGDDLESLINKTLTSREQEANQLANLQAVDTKLDELYGTDAATVIEKKGGELGLSKEYLREMAGNSPAAFFTLIGEEAPKVNNPVTQSTVNTTSAYNQTADRDYNYYSKIRKETPSVYFSARVQREMEADFNRLGSKFFN